MGDHSKIDLALDVEVAVKSLKPCRDGNASPKLVERNLEALPLQFGKRKYVPGFDLRPQKESDLVVIQIVGDEIGSFDINRLALIRDRQPARFNVDFKTGILHVHLYTDVNAVGHPSRHGDQNTENRNCRIVGWTMS